MIIILQFSSICKNWKPLLPVFGLIFMSWLTLISASAGGKFEIGRGDTTKAPPFITTSPKRNRHNSDWEGKPPHLSWTCCTSHFHELDDFQTRRAGLVLSTCETHCRSDQNTRQRKKEFGVLWIKGTWEATARHTSVFQSSVKKPNHYDLVLQKSRSLTRKQMIALRFKHMSVLCVSVHVCVITHQWNMKSISMRKAETTSVRIHMRPYSRGVCRDIDHKWDSLFYHGIKLYYGIYQQVIVWSFIINITLIIKHHFWVALNPQL